MGDSLICRRADECSGCSLWGVTNEAQIARKQTELARIFDANDLKLPANLEWASLPDRGLRDRLDFQWKDRRLGLWNQGKTEILDLTECLQLSPSLQQFLEDFRRFRLPVARGSLRLRVSPEGLRGLWLDLANADVKALFDEVSTLQKISELCQVEIGQRRKALIFQDGKPKLLKEPRFAAWTRTWIDAFPFPLQSRIADFSQVGDVANRAIIQALMTILPSGEKIVEFGAGNGNLSFAAMSRFKEMLCFEYDTSAALSMNQSLREYELRFPLKRGHLQILQGDYQRQKASLEGADTVLLNPPRSGVGRFLEDLGDSQVETLVYMSCYPESMARDLARHRDSWRCERVIMIDQFPQTDHLETLSLWRRIRQL